MMVVVDTGVYVSALVFGGVPKIALITSTQPPYQLAVSAEIKAELTETLRHKFAWSAARIHNATEYLWADVQWHKPLPIRASRDPNDDHVLGCAVAAKAQFIISGDKDLLVLHPFRKISILTPAKFLLLQKQ